MLLWVILSKKCFFITCPIINRYKYFNVSRHCIVLVLINQLHAYLPHSGKHLSLLPPLLLPPSQQLRQKQDKINLSGVHLTRCWLRSVEPCHMIRWRWMRQVCRAFVNKRNVINTALAVVNSVKLMYGKAFSATSMYIHWNTLSGVTVDNPTCDFFAILYSKWVI
jgi:hypothetical protein